MEKYRSHKIVEAGKIASFGDQGTVHLSDGELVNLGSSHDRIMSMWNRQADAGYLVRYSDGYLSWSPTIAFEDGYTRITA